MAMAQTAEKPAAAQAAAPVVQGVTLRDAMVEAYIHNPDLESARAALRAVDEQYAQAKSGFRPSLTGTAAYESAHTDGSSTGGRGSDAKTLAVGVAQPIYSGGSTVAAVDEADKTIKAARARLAAAEQAVLLDVVTAYMNVIRDRQIVELNSSNESVLSKHLDEASERFRLGAITRTDVSQSEAQRAAATSSRIAAQGSLKISRAAFERTVGLSPDSLVMPAVPAALPATLEEAIGAGLEGNPAVIEARYARDAAAAATRGIEGELLPSVELDGGLNRTYDPASGLDSRTDGTSLVVQATIPFYAGGGTHSRIRAARQSEARLGHDFDSAARGVRQSVIDAWETLATANAGLEAERAQIAAAKLAEEGTEVEARYGSRTTLEALDAQQQYLNAQVAYVASDRDRVVATYALLAALGRLTADRLNLGTPVYDPLANFRTVKDKWIGTRVQGDRFK